MVDPQIIDAWLANAGADFEFTKIYDLPVILKPCLTKDDGPHILLDDYKGLNEFRR